MIKPLIVDDETTTRNGLITHINWDTLGINEIEDACNAEDALSKAAEFKPDIILSDIVMPDMNGIELCKNSVVCCDKLKL